MSKPATPSRLPDYVIGEKSLFFGFLPFLFFLGKDVNVLKQNLTSIAGSGRLSPFSIASLHETRTGFIFFLKGGDEYPLFYPGIFDMTAPFYFDLNDNIPDGHFLRIYHEHDKHVYKAGICDGRLSFANTPSKESLTPRISACVERTVALDYYFHIKINEPTPTPNITSMDIITHPQIQNPSFFSSVLSHPDAFTHVPPGYRYDLMGDTNTILITSSSCADASVWEAPRYNGASQAFSDPGRSFAMPEYGERKKPNDKIHDPLCRSTFFPLGKPHK